MTGDCIIPLIDIHLITFQKKIYRSCDLWGARNKFVHGTCAVWKIWQMQVFKNRNLSCIFPAGKIHKIDELLSIRSILMGCFVNKCPCNLCIYHCILSSLIFIFIREKQINRRYVWRLYQRVESVNLYYIILYSFVILDFVPGGYK